MRVNPKVSQTFKEITAESRKYINDTAANRRYHKRLLKLFKEDFTEEEQLYVMHYIIEMIHYKNIVTDPDNVMTIHNIRLRTISYVFMWVVALIGIVYTLYGTNGSISTIMNTFGIIVKLIKLE